MGSLGQRKLKLQESYPMAALLQLPVQPFDTNSML